MINDLVCGISYLCREGMRKIGEGSINSMGVVKPGSRCDLYSLARP